MFKGMQARTQTSKEYPRVFMSINVKQVLKKKTIRWGLGKIWGRHAGCELGRTGEVLPYGEGDPGRPTWRDVCAVCCAVE
jgi:hypothetical protein